MQARLESVICANPLGLHRMAYWEWGDPDNDQVVLCVHGLTRNGRDFDVLAQHLAGRYRVVCPDVVGRGRSDWLPIGASYGFPQYVSDMLTLLARLRARRLVWVGTSMGGLIALSLLVGVGQLPAAQNGLGMGLPLTEAPRLQGLVLNDVGPQLDISGLMRIGAYVGQTVRFGSFQEAVEYVKTVAAGFGPHDASQWEALTRHVFVEQDGAYVKHYDLRIAEGLNVSVDPALAMLLQARLWQAYETLEAPVLVVRGQQSDILSAEMAQLMRSRQPRTQVADIAGVGHAPTLMQPEQLGLVDDFLSSCMSGEAQT